MKRVIITGGPTNEPIDEVMKITNMSTGSLSVALGEYFLKAGYHTTLVLNNAVNAERLKGENLEVIRIETTADMLEALKELSGDGRDTSAVVHASAVGDYKSDFSFLLEDMAEELYLKLGEVRSAADILKILADPECKIDDSSKISSYQKNLTVKLGLTPKIIGRLREWYPESLLIGCKLLDNVAKEELFDAARELCAKNRMDYILANDLSDLRAGKTQRYLVSSGGYTGISLNTPEDIYNFITTKIHRIVI